MRYFSGGHQWKHDEGHSLKFYLAEASFNESHTLTVCVLGQSQAEETRGTVDTGFIVRPR